MLEKNRGRIKWGKWAGFAVLVLVIIWFLATSMVFVPPHTMIAVKEPGGMRALVNRTDAVSVQWKWPYIYTLVGWKEEPVKLQQMYQIEESSTMGEIVNFYELNPEKILRKADIKLVDEEKQQEFQKLMEEGDYKLAFEKIKSSPLADESEIPVPTFKEARNSFAFYTADEVTGKPEDKTRARSYTVQVRFIVENWEKYLEIDLEDVNKQRRRAGPWYSLMKDRAEVIAQIIQDVVRRGGTTGRFGQLIKTEEGYPAMDVSTAVDYYFNELISRRNFIIALLDHYPFLKKKEQIMEYLRNKAPWYYFAGPSTFEHLAQQWKETIEATLSPYTEDVSPEASNRRVIFNEERVVLYQQAYQAWRYEDFLMEKRKQLKSISLQRRLGEEFPQLGEAPGNLKEFLQLQQKQLEQQEEELRLQQQQWEEQIQSTISFFKHYCSSNSDLALRMRRITSKQNDALWEAAIEHVFHSKGNLVELRPFWIHKIQKGETLQEIIKKYQVDWHFAFHQSARMSVFQSLPMNKKTDFARLFKEGIGGGYQKAYQFVKDVPLLGGENLIIWRTEKFSEEWFKMQEEYRKEREKIIKTFIYPIVEKFTPQVVDKYLLSSNSPWIDYIENTYGVNILDVRLQIKNEQMLDQAGMVKPEYYELYLEKSEQWQG